MNDCPHLSADGVDQTEGNDPAKVWRCTACGFTYRDVVDPNYPWHITGHAEVDRCRACNGLGEVVVPAPPGATMPTNLDQCMTCSGTGWVET